MQRREEERKAEFERQQKEFEAAQQRREKVLKARSATFERILDVAPATFTAAQLRAFLRLVVRIDPYSFLEMVASHFAGENENLQQTEEEIVLAALDATAEDKLASFALRLVLTDHLGIPRETDPDLLAEAEEIFAPALPKASKAKAKEGPSLGKVPAKRPASRKSQAA